MRIIDAHHHLWIPDTTEPDLGYGWLRAKGEPKPFGDPTPIQRNYEWAEYASESGEHELLGSIYVQVDGAIADPVAETAWVQSVFSSSPLRHGIVGLVNLADATAVEVIEQQREFSAFKGVRQIISRLDSNPSLSFAPEHYLRNPLWREQFGLLAGFGLSFDLQLYPEQMLEAADFLALHPGVAVVVDHAGSPHDQSAAGIETLRSGLRALAALPHVLIKLSGFGMFDRQWNATSIRPIMEIILDQFGSERVMYGSNFPVDKLMTSYDKTISHVSGSLPVDNAALRQAIFCDNAARFYRI